MDADIPNARCMALQQDLLALCKIYLYGPRANKDWTLKNNKNQWAEAGARQIRVGHNIKNKNPKISYCSRWDQAGEVNSISSSYGSMTLHAHQKYKLQVSQDNFTLSKKEL